MTQTWIIIAVHQIVFQGLFVSKNIILHRKTGHQIRGNNIEANLSIVFFILFIGTALWISLIDNPYGRIQLLSESFSLVVSGLLLFFNLLISTASLLNLKDSWRVGVVENHRTTLVTSGIYRITRNPYFVSYFFMFFAYTILLQNVVLFGLSLIGIAFVHKMIKKEEAHLFSVHGKVYLAYRSKVPRYIIL